MRLHFNNCWESVKALALQQMPAAKPGFKPQGPVKLPSFAAFRDALREDHGCFFLLHYIL